MVHIDKSIQLKPEEEVLEVVREDVVPHLPRFFLLFLWFVIPFFFLFPLFRQGIGGVVLFFALAGSAAIVGWRSYLKWSNTVFVLTDRRVIDVDRKGFFDRVVSEVPFAHIDDVTYRVKGIIPTVFRFGDVRLHISGSNADIEFRRVPRPSRIHDLLNDLREHAASVPGDRKEHTLRNLAKGMSMEEIQRVAAELKKRERDDALKTLYPEDHA